MDTSMNSDENVGAKIVEHDSSVLDLVFAMDCTGSMGAYIASATQNIRSIVEEIITSERSDVRLALIEYRDHPPQDMTFVTRVHDFTEKVNEMKRCLEQCQAQGGGDTPEAVADALHDVLRLSWRSKATKICILISDAPPHGLNLCDDHFPNGCPAGHDPMKIVRGMAENNITLYTVGVEPPIIPYREFFMSLAYITGGQYVPLENASYLAQVIIGGVREEISLDRLMNDAQQDIAREIQQAEDEGIDDGEAARRINRIFQSKNIRVKQMRNTRGATSKIVEECYSKCADMNEIKSKYKQSQEKPQEKMEEINYTLKEDNVTVEQAKRLIQKVKNRRSVKTTPTALTGEETTVEKQTRKNHRKEENDNSKRRPRRAKRDAMEASVAVEDQNEHKETPPHDVEMSETQQLQDQDKTEQNVAKVRNRRGKRKSPVGVREPKQKINRRSKKTLNENSDPPKTVTEDVLESGLSTDTTDENPTAQPILHTEQVYSSLQPSVRSNHNLFFLIGLSVSIAIIATYFSLFNH